MKKNRLEDLPIDSANVIRTSAHQTIGNIYDALVELITNSDDSYLRLEREGKKAKGDIDIEVVKENKKCKSIGVWDEATGMTGEELMDALEFAGEQSIASRTSVRGLFGKGLKEAVVALGDGSITTTKNGVTVRTRILIRDGRPKYDKTMLENEDKSNEPDGTHVLIEIKKNIENRASLPQATTFVEHLSKHYALRKIMNSQNRKVCLHFNEGSTKRVDIINYKYPKAIMVIDKEQLPLFNSSETISLKLHESETPLSYTKNPWSDAGILICSGNTVIDNTLLKFDNEEAGKYFYGTVECPGIEKRLLSDKEEEKNEGLSIITQNRKGLDWTKEYSSNLKKTIEKGIEEVINKKASQLKQISKTKVDSSTRKSFKRIISLMNQLAKEYFWEEGELPSQEVTNLMIKPSVANVEAGGDRALTIYAPYNLVMNSDGKAKVKIFHDEIKVDRESVKLTPHENGYYTGHFKVIGCKKEAEAVVQVELGNEKAQSTIRVLLEIIKSGVKRKLKPTKGGFIKDIQPDSTINPNERVSYADGTIYVYINFPTTQPFFPLGFSSDTTQQKLIISELLSEAFTSSLATKKFELGEDFLFPDNPIEGYRIAVNEARLKFQKPIQDILLKNWEYTPGKSKSIL